VKKMKREYLLVLFVIVAVSLAGCTGPGTPVPPVQVSQAITTMSTVPVIPAVTAVRQTAPPVALETTATPVHARIFTGDYHRVGYRENNTVTMPPNPRYQWEYALTMEKSSGNYEGSPAVHYKITSVSDYPEWVGQVNVITKNGRVTVEDTYYEPSTDRFLGVTTTGTIKGVADPSADSITYSPARQREDSPGGWLGITPFGEMNITLTDMGTESVTVPAGTYPAARKYSGKFRDGTPITFWTVPGIPVPVQYQFPNKHLDGNGPFQSYELKAWE
jgi:hypothetical protein